MYDLSLIFNLVLICPWHANQLSQQGAKNSGSVISAHLFFETWIL